MASERRRSGGRSLAALLVVLVLLGALLFAADRVAQQVAEGQAAKQVQRKLGTATRPEVDIEGFPFLTQAYRGTLDSVHVVADDVTATGREGVSIAHLDLRLRSLSSPDRFQTFTAGQAAGTATIDYPTVKKLTGQPLTYAPVGKVQVPVKTSLAGLPVTATVVGRPVVDVEHQTLSLSKPQLSVSGIDVPDSTAQALLKGLLKPAAITGLPYGLTLTDVAAGERGLDASVTGENVKVGG